MSASRRTIWVYAFLLASAFPNIAALAQSPRVELDAESRAIVDQLTLDRAAAIAALQHRADEREAGILAELNQRDRVLRQALSDAGVAQRARDEVRSQLVTVTAQRQGLIDAIAARDGQFGAEIAEYRRQIASIAASPDPRKRAALARYAEGDRQGALDVLIDIQNAETAAVVAGWRDVAERAIGQHSRGELGSDDAIAIVGRAAGVAGTDRGLWRALSALLAEVGRTEEAARAAARAATLPPDPD